MAVINRVSIFYERFSDIYWRLTEVGIDAFYKRSLKYRKIQHFVLDRHLEEIERKMEDETEISTIEAPALWMLLSSGLVLSLGDSFVVD